MFIPRHDTFDDIVDDMHLPCWKISFFLLLILTFGGIRLSAFQESKSDATPEANETSESVDEVDEILAGHSYHGEAFNEGPRQKAFLMGGTGNVEFSVTTSVKEAQAFILQGIGQLHGFWDLEAERSFRQAIALDENCAMAYWGAALAAHKQKERAKGFIEKALELKDKVTEREKMYIDALNKYLGEKPESKSKRAEQYIKDLESISLKFPEDLEAKAFIAHRIWQNNREGVPISSYLAADALIREILREEPLHPSHHYMIHLWDHREPAKALESAARCGISAPNIAHMWHMPGHIYSRLKRYEDAVYQQEASARVDHAQMMRDQLLPDQIHNFSHNNEWLIRNLVFVGRVDDALALAENMISLPRHPKYNTLKKKSGSGSYGHKRLIEILRQYQLYDQAIDYCNSGYLAAEQFKSSDLEVEAIRRERLLGCSLAAVGQDCNQVISRINKRLQKNQKILDQALWEYYSLRPIEKKPHKKLKSLLPITHLGNEAAKKKYRQAIKDKSSNEAMVKRCKNALLAIEGYQHFAKANSATQKNDVTSASQEYAHAFKKLTKAGDESKCWLAELQFLSGEKEKAIKAIEKTVGDQTNQVIPLARQAMLYDRVGDTEKVKKAFDDLRNVSSQIDLKYDLFARLEPIAGKLGYGNNWLKPRSLAADTGFRPELESLGPLRWSAPDAPEWKLLNPHDSMTASSDFKGQAYIVIFFLGHGCLHCAEQLQAFAPQYATFKEAGFEMVAISSDGDAGLRRSLEDYSGNMPIPLLSNEDLDVFKKFRAFDDFEKQPLHGTFLIDGQGKIRWQDISYEPFMDHEFLLSEAKRLIHGMNDKASQTSEPKVTRRKP